MTTPRQTRCWCAHRASPLRPSKAARRTRAAQRRGRRRPVPPARCRGRMRRTSTWASRSAGRSVSWTASASSSAAGSAPPPTAAKNSCALRRVRSAASASDQPRASASAASTAAQPAAASSASAASLSSSSRSAATARTASPKDDDWRLRLAENPAQTGRRNPPRVVARQLGRAAKRVERHRGRRRLARAQVVQTRAVRAHAVHRDRPAQPRRERELRRERRALRLPRRAALPAVEPDLADDGVGALEQPPLQRRGPVARRVADVPRMDAEADREPGLAAAADATAAASRRARCRRRRSARGHAGRRARGCACRPIPQATTILR